MENQIWDDEVSTDNDAEIARIEAEIASEKLSSLASPMTTISFKLRC